MTLTHEPTGAAAPPESTELAPVATGTLSAAERLAPAITQFVEGRKAFRGWLLSQLEAGVHYGIPPGCEPKLDDNGNLMVWNGRRKTMVSIGRDQWRSKPTLYQAGAQMLCELLGFRPEWHADEVAWRMLGAVSGSYACRCRLIFAGGPFAGGKWRIGEVVGEGVGGCEADEKGHGANTRMKIAEKRAMVAAVVTALSLADLFTQDLDNMAPPGEAPPADPNAPRVGTRSERQNDPKPLPPEVAAAVAEAIDTFKHVKGEQGGKPAFNAYAAAVLSLTPGIKFEWTVEAANKVNNALLAEADDE